MTFPRWKGIVSAGTCVLVVAVVAAGCAGNGGSTSDRPPTPARVETPTAGAPAERPSNLTYGTVTSTVKKGKTTQLELIELFGGPNISTTDADGLETWVYERTASTTDTAGTADARNLDAFFGAGAGFGPVVVGGGAAGGTRSSNDQRRTSTSVRTLTVVVKFNADKTVRDYSARASQF